MKTNVEKSVKSNVKTAAKVKSATTSSKKKTNDIKNEEEPAKTSKKETIRYIAPEVRADEKETEEILNLPVESFEHVKPIRTKAEKAPKVKKEKGPGVIATIVSLVENAGKKGITKAEIHAKLIEIFPDRDPVTMMATVNTQIHSRIKEYFPVEKLEGGFYRKAIAA